jgi:hypothetical protein
MRSDAAYRNVIRLLLAGVVIALILQVSTMWRKMEFGSPGTDDFIEYWSAGQLLLHGKNPYDLKELLAIEVGLGAPYRFPNIMWNPPWLLLWILPLLLLPFKLAALVWLFLNLALLLACGTVIWRLLAPAQVCRRIAVAWVATLVFIPGLLAIRMGQMPTLLLAGVVGFFYCVAKDKPLLGGMFLILTTIKPHVVYLFWIAVVWWVITERQWKVVVGAGVTMAVSLGALTAASPTWISGYQRVLQSPPLYWASTTVGTILRLLIFRNWPSAQFLPTVVGGLLFVGYLLIKRPRLNWRTALSPLLLASVATAAYGWTFDQTVLLVPYLQIVAGLAGDRSPAKVQRKRRVVAALLSIGAVMLIGNQLKIADFWYFWTPWALGAVYAYAGAAQR